MNVIKRKCITRNTEIVHSYGTDGTKNKVTQFFMNGKNKIEVKQNDKNVSL